MLVLLALEEVEAGENPAGRSPLDLARSCARHLLATRTRRDSPRDGAVPDGGQVGGQHRSERSPRAWVTIKDLPHMSGFSHGAAGIAYALSRLY